MLGLAKPCLTLRIFSNLAEHYYTLLDLTKPYITTMNLTEPYCTLSNLAKPLFLVDSGCTYIFLQFQYFWEQIMAQTFNGRHKWTLPFYLRQLSCHDYFRGRRLPIATMRFTKTALIKIEAGLEIVRRGHTDLELQFEKRTLW